MIGIPPEPPVRIPDPMLLQSWRDCAFLHWAVDPDALLQHLPPALALEKFDGRAWVGLVAFSMPRLRPGPLPPVPGLTRATEFHLRTYVSGPDGSRGIWMLSLDIEPLAAALAGRFVFALPYWWAAMEVERSGDTVRYRSRRKAGPSAGLDLELRVGNPVPPGELGALDHFLTARWVLFAGAGPVGLAMATEHPRWRFRRVEAGRVRQTMLDALGLPVEDTPLVHFSDGVDATIDWPHPFRLDG